MNVIDLRTHTVQSVEFFQSARDARPSGWDLFGGHCPAQSSSAADPNSPGVESDRPLRREFVVRELAA